jgi:high-affinity K+ transport system ATPase subunit B
MNFHVQDSKATNKTLWRSLVRFLSDLVRRRRNADECHTKSGGRGFSPPLLMIEANQVIAVDGNIIEGAAYVDESAITGQSAPVIREAGRISRVVRGTRVVTGRILVEITPLRSRCEVRSARHDNHGKGQPDTDSIVTRSQSTACSTSI